MQSSIELALASGDAESVPERSLAAGSFPVGETVLAPHAKDGTYRRAQV